MTREHMYFIPFIFALGVVAGSLGTRHRLSSALPSAGSKADAPRVRGRSLVWLLALFVVLFLVTHVFSLHGGAHQVEQALGDRPIFDQRTSRTADEVYSRIEAFGAAGRAAYQVMTYTTDVVFPLALLLFLVQLSRYVLERMASKPPYVTGVLLLAPAWFLVDMAENAVVYRLLAVYPAHEDALAARLANITDLKFSLLVAALAVPAWLSVFRRKPHAAFRAYDVAALDVPTEATAKISPPR